MGRGPSRGALVLLVLLALLAGAWLVLSTGARRGTSARVDASVPAAGGSGERVELRLADPPQPEPAARGREEVSAPAAEDPRLASAAGYLELAPGEGLLQIRVITIETRRPLAGVALRLELPDEPGAGAALARQELVSNAQGRVDCRAPADTECQLALARESAPAPRWRVRPVPDGEIRTVVLQLFASTDLVWYARAIDAATGAPLPDAHADLVERDPLVEPSILFRVQAEPDGMLRLACNSSRENFVRVEAPGRATRVLEIEPGHEERRDAALVELSQASALEVCVSDAQGNPLADLELSVSCARDALIAAAEADTVRDEGDPVWHARTSAAGCARVDGLPPRVALTLQLASGGKPVHQDVLDEGLAPGRAATLCVQIGPGRTLAGRTQLPDGEPCAHVGLWLLPARRGKRHLDRSMREHVFQRTVSDAEGRFRFDDVPAGRWFVGPEPVGGSLPAGSGTLLLLEQAAADGRNSDLAPVAEEVTLHDDGPIPELVLTCWSDLYLSGQVVGPDGEDFLFVRARGEGMLLTEVVSSDGSFRLGPLAPGLYELTASSESGESATVAAQAGTEGLVLRLEPRADAKQVAR